MICTSSYKAWQSDIYKTYSISGNRGKDANYEGECYPALAPKKAFWKIWHDNIGKISEEENNRYYIKEYWNQVLSKLDPENVYNELDNSALLCYEDNMQFCHRHIVAAWFEILLGIEVPEMQAKDYKVVQVSRPEYIKEYLEEVMRLNRDMHGFKSLRSLYLYEKAEKCEEQANNLEDKNGFEYIHYKRMASLLRCDIETEEERYKKYNKQKRIAK